MSTVFCLRKVTKRFGQQVALDTVSLAAGRGQVVAMLGENGAGKTTAIRILLGLLDADNGSSHVFNMNSCLHGEEIRRMVGYLPDRPSVYKWMTVTEIGWFAAGFYPQGYLSRYQELVRRFEVPEDRKLKHLSKGMLAKVSLSLAMAHEPGLLVLDEPTSGLDPLVRREFLESMVDVASEGRTVLLSSHQIDEVERVADMVAILRKGQLVACEQLEDLKNNVCELTVTLSETGGKLPAIPGRVLREESSDRQHRLLVRDFDEQQLDQVRGHTSVGTVDLRYPSLEEIFVGYMKASDTDVEPEPIDGEVVSMEV